MKPTKKVTPKDSSFDAADYDVPIEVEAYNNGVNETIDQYEAWLKSEECMKKLERIIFDWHDLSPTISLAKTISKRLSGKGDRG